MLAAFGAVNAATSMSFDGTKWDVAQQAAKLAKNPSRVDGGFEWNNYHTGTVKFRWTAHPSAACIALSMEHGRATDDPAVVRTSRVWSPPGTSVWVVARQVRPC